jgi:hypothetical protein
MASKTDKRNDPSTTSMAYDMMSPRWQMIQSLMDGTEGMRNAGELFLPRHPRERNIAYDERLTRAVLFNLFELTLDLLSGKPFTEKIVLEDGMPSNIVEYAEDIDLQGNDLTRFSYEVFREGLAKGFTHVLVDAPKASEEVVSLADEEAMGIRPYFVHIQPEALIFAESERLRGEEVYTHLRFLQTEVSRDGFMEVHKEYIRILDLMSDVNLETGEEELFVRCEWWHQPEKGKDKGKWVVDRSKTAIIELDRIPLQTFYTNRDGFMVSKPPLLDLAYMNVEHWQSYSDQTNILTVTRFPMLASSGVSDYDMESTVIGPREMLIADDPSARFYYVEHSGAAIAAGEKSIKDLENRMASYGSSLLQKRPDRETASARAAAEESVTSPLQRMVHAFRDFLKTSLGYMNELDGGKAEAVTAVDVRDDFSSENVDAVELQTLQVAVKEGYISRQGFLEELKRKRVLSPDFNVEDDFALLKAEIVVRAEIAAASKGLSGVQDPKDQTGPKGEDEEEDGRGTTEPLGEGDPNSDSSQTQD